jgi:lysophospholipase L1-like esterase
VIPSKELVVAQWAKRRKYALDPQLIEPTRGEQNLSGKYRELFDQAGIEWIDALPFLIDALDRALETGDELYLWDSGHPLAAGYRAYAEAAAALVERLEAQ